MLLPFLYLTHNKRKSFLIVAIIVISVFSINFANSLVQSIYDTCSQVSVVPYSKFSVITPEEKFFEKSDWEMVVQNNKVENVYNVQIETTSIRTVFGSTSTYIFFLNNENQLAEFMEKCKLTLTEGNIPKKDAHEIILHENIAKNKGKSVGDTIGDYTIVGLISGEVEISFGSLNKNYDDSIEFFENNEMATSILVLVTVEKQDEINHELKDLFDKKINIFDYAYAVDNLEEEFSTITLILMLIVVMIAVSLSIAIAALTYSNYSGRYDEFGILNAIGYSKNKINKMIMDEILILSLTGWLLGFAFSELALYIVNSSVYAEMGQHMNLISAKSIGYTLIIPLFVFVFSLTPVSRRLRKTDLISIIERR